MDSGRELDLSLLDLGGGHVVVLGDGAQTLGGFVLVEHAFRLFPDIEVILSHGEQDGDIPLRHDMALAEPGILGDAGDDLGEVVAEHMAHRVLCFNELHLDGSSLK